MGVMSSLGDAPGIPVIDRDSCSDCGSCIEACPVGVLSRSDDGVRVDGSAGFGCIACAHCMMVCPNGSIAVSGRGLSASDLVDLSGEAPATPEQVEALFRARRSVRRFRDEEVSPEAIARIVAAASSAPMGIPPWEVGVVVFRGKDKVRALAADTARTYASLLKFVDHRVTKVLLRPFLKAATWHQLKTFILPLGQEIVRHWKAGEDKVLYRAPAALLFHTSPYADSADAFIACTYAMIAAESMGLGACMIGCLAPPLARRRDLLAKYGVPEGHKPAIVLILGHPSVNFRRGVRRAFLRVTEW
jgi:nitroreductase/NAD-dependent dihydropyrimidine dehydrogenase PreA subunit